jgi:hypothetical protein
MRGWEQWTTCDAHSIADRLKVIAPRGRGACEKNHTCLKKRERGSTKAPPAAIHMTIATRQDTGAPAAGASEDAVVVRAQLPQYAKTASKPDPIYCAIAAYRGSWDHPDTRFADTVRATVEKGNAPNFDMPKDAYFDASDIASDTPISGINAGLSTPERTPDDRALGWSSALFPAKSPKPDSASVDAQSADRAADEARSPSPPAAAPAASRAPVDSLFVPRSSERRP